MHKQLLLRTMSITTPLNEIIATAQFFGEINAANYESTNSHDRIGRCKRALVQTIEAVTQCRTFPADLQILLVKTLCLLIKNTNQHLLNNGWMKLTRLVELAFDCLRSCLELGQNGYLHSAEWKQNILLGSIQDICITSIASSSSGLTTITGFCDEIQLDKYLIFRLQRMRGKYALTHLKN